MFAYPTSVRGYDPIKTSLLVLFSEVARDEQLGVSGNDWNVVEAKEEPTPGEYPHQQRGQAKARIPKGYTRPLRGSLGTSSGHRGILENRH